MQLDGNGVAEGGEALGVAYVQGQCDGGAAFGFEDLPDTGPCKGAAAAFEVAAVTPELTDAWVRMLRLMRVPADIPALAPVYEWEIRYRVLQGPQGPVLPAIAMPDSGLARIRQTVQWIRSDFDKPLRVEDVAKRAAMSLSAFHRHFKAATSMSPLQYQKRIRLLRARPLLLARSHPVATVAFSAGYGSANQFSRDDARAFGLPPTRDAARVMAASKLRR